MIAAFFGYGTSRLLQHESLYHVLAKGFLHALPAPAASRPGSGTAPPGS